MTRKISVFGGSNPKPGTSAYEQAFALGKLLGGAGLDVITGGYMGTMAATSQGAKEAGGHVIGAACQEIEDWRPVAPNHWVDEEWHCETLLERLDKMIKSCEAAIALPGGVGTLLEICLTWNLLAIDALNPKPVILIGEEWHSVMRHFFISLGNYIPMRNREFLAFAPNPEAAFELLGHFLQLTPPKTNK
ncbi:MAG: LOG family protein [Chloroflexota bacterium]|nr:LOG family protein [Chloroflexota bacterium]